MKFENTEVYNFKGALRGMRMPLQSHDKSDSVFHDNGYPCIIGKNDLLLAQKLIKAGSEHRKFMRQIFVSADITAPCYWWQELDTYKVGVTRNSSSMMHTITSRKLTEDDFEVSDSFSSIYLVDTVVSLNFLIEKYNRAEDKDEKEKIFRTIRQVMPMSYLYRSTVTMNYENVLNMIRQRKNHRLTEWSVGFIDWSKTLPYAEELLFCLPSLDSNSFHSSLSQ